MLEFRTSIFVICTSLAMMSVKSGGNAYLGESSAWFSGCHGHCKIAKLYKNILTMTKRR